MHKAGSIRRIKRFSILQNEIHRFS